MFRNRLANHETYSKANNGEYDLESSFSCYEVFIEVCRDKDGKTIKNRDGSDRYYVVDDASVVKLEAPRTVKVIRDGLYKDVYKLNDEYLERVERDNKSHIYFVVKEDKVTVLEAGTNVVIKNGLYRLPKEIGFVLVDDRNIEKPRIVKVGKFKTEDHKAEAEQLVRGKKKDQEAEE